MAMSGRRCQFTGSNRLAGKIIAAFGLLLALEQLNAPAAEPQGPPERISRPGQYQGYSEARFDGGRRTSQYIPMRDGARIAVTCADKDSHQTPQCNPAPTITVFRDAEHSSYVILPVVD